MIPRPALLTLILGATLLAAAWAVVDRAHLALLLPGVGITAAVLLGAGVARALPARFRAARLEQWIREQFPQAIVGESDPARRLYNLPWYVLLDPDAPTLTVEIGTDAVFVRLDACAAESTGLLETLRRLRPRAPLSGAVLAVAADSLMTGTAAQAGVSSAALSAQVAALSSAVRVRFPLTVLITHGDALRGFRPFAEAMGAGGLVGWANPAQLDAPVPLSSFNDAIAQITADLRRARLAPLTETAADPLGRAQELFALPDRVAGLAGALRHLAAALATIHLADNRPRFFLRGLYLVSGRDFLPAVLSQRLLPERFLVCPANRPARRRSPSLAVAAGALLAPSLAVGLALARNPRSSFAFWGARHEPSPRPIAARGRPNPPANNPQSREQAYSLRPLADLIAQVAGGVREAIDRVGQQLPRAAAADVGTTEAVMARADELAAASEPFTPLPDLPCTAPPPISARFSPSVAAALFAEYAAIADALPPDERGPIADAYSGYAEQFVRAWSSRAPAPIEPSTWPQLRQKLTAMNPARVNRDLRDMLLAVDRTLALVPSELGQDQPIERAHAAIRREAEALDRPWFDAACRRTRDKWVGLEPASARASIVRLSRERFEADYLEVYSEPQVPGSRYWSSLILAALSSVADGSAPRSDAAAFIQNTRAFPLCLTAPRTLAPADLAAARDFAAAIIRTGLSSTPLDDALPLSRGTRTDHPRINAELARLVGNSEFDDEARDRWGYRIRAVLAFLEDPQTCQLVILDPTQQVPISGSVPAAVLVPSFDLIVGGSTLGPFYTDHGTAEAVTFSLPGPTVRFTFRSAAGPVASVELPEPWNALTLLRQPGAVLDDASDPSGRLVKAPLFFTDAAGRRLCYWIGLRFQRPPPALAQWPTDDDWPN